MSNDLLNTPELNDPEVEEIEETEKEENVEVPQEVQEEPEETLPAVEDNDHGLGLCLIAGRHRRMLLGAPKAISQSL